MCVCVCVRRYPWCNGYRRRKWTRRYEFKSWTRLISFHIALIRLGKLWIQLFSLQLWVNSRADWVLQPWWGKPVKLRLKIDLVSYPARAEGLVNMVFVSNVVCSYRFLSIYTRISKNVIECVDFSWSHLISSCTVFSLVLKLISFASPPVYMMIMLSMYLT